MVGLHYHLQHQEGICQHNYDAAAHFRVAAHKMQSIMLDAKRAKV